MESENRQWLLSIIFPATDKHRKDRAACSRDDSVLSTSVSCRKLRGNRKSTGGWNVPITMCICTTAFQNAFTYITSLYCNKFGLRLAGPILQRKDLRSRQLTLRKLYRKHLFHLLVHCFHFLVQKPGTPWVA